MKENRPIFIGFLSNITINAHSLHDFYDLVAIPSNRSNAYFKSIIDDGKIFLI